MQQSKRLVDRCRSRARPCIIGYLRSLFLSTGASGARTASVRDSAEGTLIPIPRNRGTTLSSTFRQYVPCRNMRDGRC
jgi:hypothetical protein